MLPDKVKENPIKSAISVVTLVAGLFGGVLSIDSRYAKAADIEQQQQSIKDNARETKFAIDQLRKQSIEDKIFEIELIPETSRVQIDRARLEKYKRDLRTLEQKWQ